MRAFHRVLSAGLCVSVISGWGCDQRNDRTPSPSNTAQNERDRNNNNPTPTDQGESESDRRITADIRKLVMGEASMSTNGKNSKIITRNGHVTLRGPVASQSERDKIESLARSVAGVTSVTNELEVTK